MAVDGVPETFAIGTIVVLGTGILVITKKLAKGLMSTATVGITGVDGTPIPIIAGKTLPHALSLVALVIGSTEAAVIAGPLPGYRKTATVCCDAIVEGTGVPIIAKFGSGHAEASNAMVVEGAEVPVIAGLFVGR